MVNRDELVKNLSIATKIVGNRNTSMGDFLTMYEEDGRLVFQAIGDGHEMVLDVADFEGEVNGEVNIDYKKFGSVLKVLNEEVDIQLSEEGMEISDGSAKAKLASYEDSGVEVNREDRKNRMVDAVENGYKVNRKEFLDALVYLHGLRGRSEENELMKDCYFTEEFAFIYDERYIVRLNFKSPVPLVLDGNTSDILIAFLKGNEDEYFYLNKVDEGTVEFVIGSNYYEVSGLSSYVKDITQTLNSYEPVENVKVGLSEFIRFIELATVFLEDDEEDVVCKMDEGQGRILSDTNENSSDGTFAAEGVDGVEIGLNAFDVLTIIGGLKGTVSDELDLSMNLSSELVYFKHDKGDCLLAVLDRS